MTPLDASPLCGLARYGIQCSTVVVGAFVHSQSLDRAKGLTFFFSSSPTHPCYWEIIIIINREFYHTMASQRSTATHQRMMGGAAQGWWERPDEASPRTTATTVVSSPSSRDSGVGVSFDPCRIFGEPVAYEDQFCLHCRHPCSSLSVAVGPHATHLVVPLLENIHTYPVQLWQNELEELKECRRYVEGTITATMTDAAAAIGEQRTRLEDIDAQLAELNRERLDVLDHVKRLEREREASLRDLAANVVEDVCHVVESVLLPNVVSPLEGTLAQLCGGRRSAVAFPDTASSPWAVLEALRGIRQAMEVEVIGLRTAALPWLIASGAKRADLPARAASSMSGCFNVNGTCRTSLSGTLRHVEAAPTSPHDEEHQDDALNATLDSIQLAASLDPLSDSFLSRALGLTRRGRAPRTAERRPIDEVQGPNRTHTSDSNTARDGGNRVQLPRVLQRSIWSDDGERNAPCLTSSSGSSTTAAENARVGTSTNGARTRKGAVCAANSTDAASQKHRNACAAPTAASGEGGSSVKAASRAGVEDKDEDDERLTSAVSIFQQLRSCLDIAVTGSLQRRGVDSDYSMKRPSTTTKEIMLEDRELVGAILQRMTKIMARLEQRITYLRDRIEEDDPQDYSPAAQQRRRLHEVLRSQLRQIEMTVRRDKTLLRLFARVPPPAGL